MLACKNDCRRYSDDLEAAFARDPDYLRLDYIKQSCPGIKRVVGCSARDPAMNELSNPSTSSQRASNATNHGTTTRTRRGAAQTDAATRQGARGLSGDIFELQEPDHVHAGDFGKLSVLKAFHRRIGAGASPTGGPELILFDYFWLQTGHYRRRYGTTWLSHWVPAAFGLHPALAPSVGRGASDYDFGLDSKIARVASAFSGPCGEAAPTDLKLPNLKCVILPIDGGQKGCASSSDMMRMLADYHNSPAAEEHRRFITVTTMTLLEAEMLHPLVVATCLADPELLSNHQGRSHDSQAQWLYGWRDGAAHRSAVGRRAAEGGGPCFVVIHRRGLDWKKWLLGLQQLDALPGSDVRVRQSAPSRAASRQPSGWLSGKIDEVMLHQSSKGDVHAAPEVQIQWEDKSRTKVLLPDALRMLVV